MDFEAFQAGRDVRQRRGDGIGVPKLGFMKVVGRQRCLADGDGRLRADALESVFGPELMALFRDIKAAFDPAGILNPGIKLPGGGAPIARLKAGAAAAAIPDDIALALRDIERTGGYARARLELAP